MLLLNILCSLFDEGKCWSNSEVSRTCSHVLYIFLTENAVIIFKFLEEADYRRTFIPLSRDGVFRRDPIYIVFH